MSSMATAPAYRRLPRAVREQQMLDAAVAVFARLGYYDASVDAIAEAAGVSKPMVYAYLGTKEQLFIACLQREGDRLATALARAAEDGLAPDEQLWRGLRAFFGFVADHRDGWQVLHRQARTHERFGEVRATIRAGLAQMLSVLLTRAGTGAGLLVRPDDADTIGYALVGAAEAAADRMLEHPRATPEATATRLMNLVWLGAQGLLRGQAWSPASRPAGTQPDRRAKAQNE
jgi:AcrR family transcriptional regulator